MTDTDSSSITTPSKGRLAPTSYEWAFHLSGNEHWLQNFTNHFSSVDVQILPDYEDDRPPYFDFTSHHLNGLTGSQAAMRAQELLILFNGVMRLQVGVDFREFTLGQGRHLETNQRARVDFYRTTSVPMFPDDVERLRYFRHRRYNPSLHPVGKRLFLSRSDRFLRVIFRTLGREGLSFVSLSKVLDTMAADYHNQGSKKVNRELAALGGKTEADLEDFGYTANNFDISGEDARHGLNAKFKPSDKRKALSLEQAAEVMLPIVTGYVKRRVDETFDAKWEEVLIDRADQAERSADR
jgi:hypothetical protein